MGRVAEYVRRLVIDGDRELGWPLLAANLVVVTVGLVCGGGGPGVVRAVSRAPLRSWWMRWLVYAPRMPRWLRACRLTVPDQGQPVAV
jgi:S-DNA-T family DNA segregation ATPase FtsK/SpoIIIE